jgi:DegV family protein with EDD domain
VTRSDRSWDGWLGSHGPMGEDVLLADVAVITDSTADLPADLAEVLGIRVVPMYVAFGEESFISRITLTEEAFYERLRHARELPTTSQPAPAWFEEAYGDAYDDGADAVVSLHVSAALSSTCDTARQVGDKADLPVHVVDSRQVSGGLALQVLAAHRAAQGGADVDDVIAAADRVRRATRSLFVVDTLDNLRKGGRLTGAQALVGNVLRVKPLLGIVDGEVQLLERTRTWRAAMERLVDLVVEHVDGERAHIVVTHAVAPDRARELWTQLEERVDVAERLEAIVGPVVGSHAGPGAVALSVCPAELT